MSVRRAEPSSCDAKMHSDRGRQCVEHAIDVLEAHGYKPLPSRSGVEALELARLHKPDLIVMDMQLPDVSGLQVTQWIKDDEHLRHIPVIAITGFATKEDEEKIRQGGCESYLAKPFSIETFLETVRNYLHAP
jgi:two-component system cell cycle response regulator DivK